MSNPTTGSSIRKASFIKARAILNSFNSSEELLNDFINNPNDFFKVQDLDMTEQEIELIKDVVNNTSNSKLIAPLENDSDKFQELKRIFKK